MAVMGNWPESHTVSVCFLHLILGISRHVHTLHKQSLGFLQPLLLVPLVFQPAKGTCPPGVGPQGRDIHYVALITLSPGKVSACVTPFLICVPSQGHRSQPDCFSSPPAQSCVALSYSLACTGVFLPASIVFSEIVPLVDVFVMCS